MMLCKEEQSMLVAIKRALMAGLAPVAKIIAGSVADSLLERKLIAVEKNTIVLTKRGDAVAWQEIGKMR